MLQKNATKKFLIMLNLIPVYSMQNENKENMQQKKILLMLSKVLLKIKKIKQKTLETYNLTFFN